MTAPEFARWIEFYKDFPFDDFHRFHRPAALIAYGKTTNSMEENLNWLQKEQIPDGMSEVDFRTLKAFMAE